MSVNDRPNREHRTAQQEGNPSSADGAFDIRPATPADVEVVLDLIRALADYERLTHLCVADTAALSHALFGHAPSAEVLIAWKDGEAAGFALFFHNFSTFLGRRGLWLEDLFVRPSHRRQGCAQALLRTLARIACERDCGRFEWAVLDWNQPAIDFYESLGGRILPDWRIVRIVGPDLRALADGRNPPDSSA